MKLQKQKYLHDPENGTWGDCDRTAVACILGYDRDEVPHFFEGLSKEPGGSEIKEAYRKREKWLAERGIEKITLTYESEDFEHLLRAVSNNNPGRPFLFTGGSRNGTGHVVICRSAEIIWDPAIDDSGIVGPHPVSGVYTIEFLIKTNGGTDQ